MSVNKALSSNLYLIRWISALLVAVEHIRTNYFVGLSKIETINLILTKIVWLVTFLGHNAVMVFFVLSGYFVGGGDDREI